MALTGRFLVLFETHRTHVELLSEWHSIVLLEYYVENENHLSKWVPARPEGYHSEDSWRQRAREYVDEYRAGMSLRLLAFRPGAGDIVAICEFTNIARGAFQACHLGYSVSQRYENTGLMTEILTAALDYVFEELGLHRVMANYMPKNKRSARVLEKLGFEQEGLAKAYLQIAGKWQDHVLTAKINPSHQLQ